MGGFRPLEWWVRNWAISPDIYQIKDTTNKFVDHESINDSIIQ